MTPLKLFSTIIAVFAAIIAFIVLFSTYYTIDQGERGVILRNGAIVGTAGPGMHFKTPFIEDVVTISVQEHVAMFPLEPAYTADRQTADITFSVNYTAVPSEVPEIYSRYGSLEGLQVREIERVARNQLKNVFGRYTAATAISEREKLSQEILAALSGTADGLVQIQSVQIENIDFSATVEKALEDRSKAEAEVQTKKQELEKTRIDAQITVTNAQADADSRVAAAKAQAEATRLAGQAEADAIRAKGDALRQNPELIELTKAERWDGVLPKTMLPNDTVPFIDVMPDQ